MKQYKLLGWSSDYRKKVCADEWLDNFEIDFPVMIIEPSDVEHFIWDGVDCPNIIIPTRYGPETFWIANFEYEEIGETEFGGEPLETMPK